MASFQGKLMAAGRSPTVGGFAGEKHCLATNVWVNDSVGVSGSDTLYFGKLPKGAVITGGRLYSGRLASGTTSACQCMGLVLGVDQILNNQSGTSFSIASNTTALGNFVPIDFRPIDVSNAYGTRPWDSGFTAPLGGLLLTQGPLTMMADGSVFATVATSALSGSGISGYLNLELDYVVGQYT